MALQPAHQIGGDEAQHAGCRFLDDEVAEARNGHAARPTLVHHGGDARPHAHHVGVQAEASGDVLIDMGMGVYHAGNDDLARDVDHLPGRRRRQRCARSRRCGRRQMPISAMPSRPDAGSITRPPRSSRSNLVRPSRCPLSQLSGMPVRSMLTAVANGASGKGARMQETVRGEGIGQSVPRLEDDRYLRGKGEFIADIRLRWHARSRLRAQPRRACAHSRASTNRPARRLRYSLRRTSLACSRSSRSPGCPGSSRRCNRCWRPTRCAMSARRSRSASPRQPRRRGRPCGGGRG